MVGLKLTAEFPQVCENVSETSYKTDRGTRCDERMTCPLRLFALAN